MKSRILLMAALATLLTSSLTAAPAAAAPTIDIRPAQLPRGADSTVARMNGDTIVDGDIRIDLGIQNAYLLGESGAQYVVAAYPRVLRVRSDGTTRRIARYGSAADPTLSDDGAQVLIHRPGRRGATIRIVDARNGEKLASRTFHGYAVPLDAHGGQAVILAAKPERTLWWNYLAGTTKRIARRGAAVADIAADRMSTVRGDPYDGGCAVVTTLSRPRQRLWRSCDEIAFAFSPTGNRMVTASLLADGLGPGEVSTRMTDGGARIATYRTYWFSSVTWETDESLILDANTRRRAATVRCVGASCERASGLRRSELRRP